MKTRLVHRALRNARSPAGRRTVDDVPGRVRSAVSRTGGGGQIPRKVDTPRTRERLERTLQRPGQR